jgi:hypothetical protein
LIKWERFAHVHTFYQEKAKSLSYRTKYETKKDEKKISNKIEIITNFGSIDKKCLCLCSSLLPLEALIPRGNFL